MQRNPWSSHFHAAIGFRGSGGTNLPLCSVIRPVSTDQAGAKAAATALTASGLFTGQRPAFFDLLGELAQEADEAHREA